MGAHGSPYDTNFPKGSQICFWDTRPRIKAPLFCFLVLRKPTICIRGTALNPLVVHGRLVLTLDVASARGVRLQDT